MTETIKTTISGGYTLLNYVQIARILHYHASGELNGRDLRVFLALVELLHQRVASYACKLASTSDKRSKSPQVVMPATYTREQLSSLLDGLSRGKLNESLRRLKKLGIASFSKHEIVIHEVSSEDHRFGTTRRRVPLPRRILRYLAALKGEKGTVAVALAYLAWAMHLKRGGHITSWGRIKTSKISDMTGVTIRSCRRCRVALIEVGALSQDTESHQLVLNRYGGRYEVNTDFESPFENYEQPSDVEPAPESAPEAVANSAVVTLSDPSMSQGLGAEKPSESAPISIHRPSNESKNHRPFPGKALRSGALTSKGNLPSEVNLNNVKPKQLKKGSALLELYRQALAQKLFQHSEANLFSFLASAVKAVRAGDDPARLFIWTIRNNFQFITGTDEEIARTVQAKIRERYPRRLMNLAGSES